MIPDSYAKCLLATVIFSMPTASMHGQPRWTLDPQPVLEIASESQGPNTLFTRIAHVEQLRTGELIVLDGATRELRFFDARGRFIRKIGRNGAGPGEFRETSGVAIAGDQIHVFDGSSKRITRFDLAGTLRSTIIVAEPPDARRGIWSYTLGGFIDDRPVFLASGFPSRNSAPPRYTDSLPQYIYSADAATARPIGEMALMDAFFESPKNKGDVIFGRFTSSAVGGGRLYVTDGGRFEVRVYDKSGTRLSTISRDIPMSRVSESDFDDYVTYRMQFARTSSRSVMRERLSPVPRAEHRPSISELLVDDRKNVWIRHWSIPGSRPSRWSGLNESGGLRAELTMPARFKPVTIRGDVVAGVFLDDDDVEGIRLLRVRSTVK